MLPKAKQFTLQGPMPNPPQGWSWQSLMAEALKEAQKAKDESEIPVGAIIVSENGQILAKAHNESIKQSDPCAHAEILALRRAGSINNNYRLNNTILVVTLEPCLMCCGALIHARIAGIVFGAADLATGSIISCIEGLNLPFHNHHPWHMGGVLSQECTAILHSFFKDNKRGESKKCLN